MFGLIQQTCSCTKCFGTAQGSWPVKKTLCVAGVLLAVVGLGSLRFSNQCLNLDALQGKSEAQMDEAIRALSQAD